MAAKPLACVPQIFVWKTGRKGQEQIEFAIGRPFMDASLLVAERRLALEFHSEPTRTSRDREQSPLMKESTL